MEAPDSGQDDTEETPSKKAKIVKKVEVAHADDNEKRVLQRRESYQACHSSWM